MAVVTAAAPARALVLLLFLRAFSGLRGGPDRYSQKKGPRRTDFRVNLASLPAGTSWQDIKRYDSLKRIGRS